MLLPSSYYRRLLAHASVRYSSINQIKSHAFFSSANWDDLRAAPAPFVPALDSEIDTGYYDDFTSPEDMAKYTEVIGKKKKVEQVKENEEDFGRGVWVGFTFGKNGPGANARGLGADAQDNSGNYWATIF